jgi:hypothetical protein
LLLAFTSTPTQKPTRGSIHLVSTTLGDNVTEAWIGPLTFIQCTDVHCLEYYFHVSPQASLDSCSRKMEIWATLERSEDVGPHKLITRKYIISKLFAHLRVIQNLLSRNVSPVPTTMQRNEFVFAVYSERKATLGLNPIQVTLKPLSMY